jgi:hypothetical protein
MDSRRKEPMMWRIVFPSGGFGLPAARSFRCPTPEKKKKVRNHFEEKKKK